MSTRNDLQTPYFIIIHHNHKLLCISLFWFLGVINLQFHLYYANLTVFRKYSVLIHMIPHCLQMNKHYHNITISLLNIVKNHFLSGLTQRASTGHKSPHLRPVLTFNPWTKTELLFIKATVFWLDTCQESIRVKSQMTL